MQIMSYLSFLCLFNFKVVEAMEWIKFYGFLFSKISSATLPRTITPKEYLLWQSLKIKSTQNEEKSQ